MDNAEAIKELEFLKIAAQIDAKPGHINIEALDYAIEKLESERTGYWETPEPDYARDGTRLPVRVAICSECQKPNRLPVGRYCSECGSRNKE